MYIDVTFFFPYGSDPGKAVAFICTLARGNNLPREIQFPLQRPEDGRATKYIPISADVRRNLLEE
jgi:hypothetical protein